MESERGKATAMIEASISDLFRAGRHWSKSFGERFDPPLSPMAFGLLRHIAWHGPVRAADLVGAFGSDKAAVSRHVAALKDSGLVIAEADPDDRRASLLLPTEHALRGLEGFREETHQQFSQMLTAFDDVELDELARLLAKFAGGLDGATGPRRVTSDD
jgi:DNA-binding MarR family transcriptional regulator